jgi:HSP20 family protein
MTLVRRPSPAGDVLTLRQAMDRLFEDSFFRTPFVSMFDRELSLPLDIRSTPDALVVEAALPGVKPDDVEITVESGTLTISGSYRSESSQGDADSGDYLVRELRRGSFSRAVALPQGLEPDRAEATFQDGLLRLRIPRAEETRPRQIRISPMGAEGARVVGDGGTSTPPAEAG